MRALMLRHLRVNRRALLGFSPLALLWLAMSMRAAAASLSAGFMLALVLGAFVMLSHEAMDPALEQFLLCLPVSRAQLVKETYLSGFLAMALGQGASVLALVLGRRIPPAVGGPIEPGTFGTAAFLYLALVLLVYLMLPFRFALGGRKGLIAFSVSFILLLGGLLGWQGVNGLLDRIGEAGLWVSAQPSHGLLAALGTAALGAASLAISIRTFRFRAG